MKHTTFFLTGIMLFLVGVSGYAFGAFHFAYGGSAENSITANLIYPYGNHDYVDFWHENKNQIARIFNPFIEQFNNSGCIDHIYLRALIKQNGEIHKKSFELVGPGADDIDADEGVVSFDGVVVRVEPEKEEPTVKNYRIAVFFTNLPEASRNILTEYISKML